MQRLFAASLEHGLGGMALRCLFSFLKSYRCSVHVLKLDGRLCDEIGVARRLELTFSLPVIAIANAIIIVIANAIVIVIIIVSYCVALQDS